MCDCVYVCSFQLWHLDSWLCSYWEIIWLIKHLYIKACAITFTLSQYRCDQSKRLSFNMNLKILTKKSHIFVPIRGRVHTRLDLISPFVVKSVCFLMDGAKQAPFAANTRLFWWQMENLVLRSRKSESSWLHIYRKTGGVKRNLYFKTYRFHGADKFISVVQYAIILYNNQIALCSSLMSAVCLHLESGIMTFFMTVCGAVTALKSDKVICNNKNNLSSGNNMEL